MAAVFADCTETKQSSGISARLAAEGFIFEKQVTADTYLLYQQSFPP